MLSQQRIRRPRALTAIGVATMLLVVGSVIFLARPAGQANAAGGFPATRDAKQWPFAWNSIWNLPLGANAELVPAGIPAASGMGMTIDENIIVLKPDAPQTPIVMNDAGWDNQRTRCGSANGGQAIAQNIPIPSNFSTDPGYLGHTPNMAAAVLLADGSTVVQTQPFHRCGAGGPATSQYMFQSADLHNGDGILGAHGGSGMSSLGGALRLGELVPGSTIRHALKVELDCERLCYYNVGEGDGKAGFRWPAVAADSGAPGRYHGSNPAVQMGSLLALAPNFDESRLQTEPARILARAMRDYGGYVVDDTGWSVYALATEWSPDGRVADEFSQAWGFGIQTGSVAGCTELTASCQWANDMATMFTSLSVVQDNGPAAVGGNGARRQPCAPPFTDGSGGAPADCGPTAGPAPAAPTTPAPTAPAPTAPAPTAPAPVPAPGLDPFGGLSLQLNRDMLEPHAGPLDGVPASYDWGQRPRVGMGSNPGTHTAATAWGEVYSSNNPATNSAVEIGNLRLLALTADGRWHTLQSTNPEGSTGIDGSYYEASFAGNVQSPLQPRSGPGGTLIALPTRGWNFHMYPQGRALLPQNLVGIVSSFDARLVVADAGGPDDRAAARMLAGAGGDYWKNLTAPWASDYSNNADFAIGRHGLVTPQWQTFTAHTLTGQQIASNPPPLTLAGAPAPPAPIPTTQPPVTQPAVTQPAVTQPAPTQPATTTTRPAVTQPAPTQPATTTTTRPAVTQPATTQPQFVPQASPRTTMAAPVQTGGGQSSPSTPTTESTTVNNQDDDDQVSENEPTTTQSRQGRRAMSLRRCFDRLFGGQGWVWVWRTMATTAAVPLR